MTARLVKVEKGLAPAINALSPEAMRQLDQFALASLSEDHKEGAAAFLQRRSPRFRGR